MFACGRCRRFCRHGHMPAPALIYFKGVTSAPDVWSGGRAGEGVLGRILGYLWVAVTAVINVFALSALLSHFGLANNVWGDPFWSLGEAYRALVDNSFAQVAGVFMDNVGPERAWIAHALVAYVATASAIAVVRERGDDGTGRNGLADGLVGGLQDVVLSGAWIATLPVFLLNSVREFRLSRFANDHARAAVVYVFSVLVIYGGARYVNAAFLEPPVDGTVMMLTNARGGGADSEERYSVADCRTLLDRGRARRAGLETAVDRALAKGDVANAEAAAQALSQLMWCESDQLGSFDKARVYFATADSFYRSGEWALARQYYKDGLFSLDYLAQDEDTGVLVNPLTTAGHQLRVIEAWKELFSAGEVRFFEEERGERAGATAAHARQGLRRQDRPHRRGDPGHRERPRHPRHGRLRRR